MALKGCHNNALGQMTGSVMGYCTTSTGRKTWDMGRMTSRNVPNGPHWHRIRVRCPVDIVKEVVRGTRCKVVGVAMAVIRVCRMRVIQKMDCSLRA
jgi:hypothetical protein